MTFEDVIVWAIGIGGAACLYLVIFYIPQKIRKYDRARAIKKMEEYEKNAERERDFVNAKRRKMAQDLQLLKQNEENRRFFERLSLHRATVARMRKWRDPQIRFGVEYFGEKQLNGSLKRRRQNA